jgi:hypothetical protein
MRIEVTIVNSRIAISAENNRIWGPIFVFEIMPVTLNPRRSWTFHNTGWMYDEETMYAHHHVIDILKKLREYGLSANDYNVLENMLCEVKKSPEFQEHFAGITILQHLSFHRARLPWLVSYFALGLKCSDPVMHSLFLGIGI